MKIAPDKVKHLKAGSCIAFYLLVLVQIAQFNVPAAILFGGVVACAFVEWYQRARGNGRAEWLDFWFGVVPAIGMALTYYLLSKWPWFQF